MKITELLKGESIDLNAARMSKTEAIKTLAGLMYRSGNLSDKERYIADVEKREREGTTGIGEGIAIPHAKSSGVRSAGLASMVVREGLDYNSLDGEDTKLFFMIAVPENSNDEHLTVLSRLSTLLMDEKFRENLINSKTKEEFLDFIDKKEREKYPEDYGTATIAPSNNGYYDLVAVTACPTGIAHTYMASEGLKKKAAQMGYTIKVETNGSTGVENRLTDEEIKNAKGVIIAADKNVAKKRFQGKRLVETKVSDGIHKPQELIEKVLDEKTPVYASNETTSDDTVSDTSAHSIYKHLMNGVSHMLPFVIGGGILIAIAFLLDNPDLGLKTFGSNTPLAKFFMTVGGGAFGFMLPVLAGFIAMSIGDRPALAVGFVGGMIANTGGSGFLGALVAGFLAGYLVVLLRKLFSFLPKSLDGMKPMLIYPVLGLLIIGALMIYIVNPPLAVVNTAVSGWLNSLSSVSKVFLGFILGAMMAVDMGGPVNKAAYVFGTASLASGSSAVMAAVMIGGMVPPLAIAAAMMIFKRKFTADERKSTVSNLIMGLSFITEGAIPFAAADPIRVIPACIVGSGIAGALSMIFNCSLRAPHGGLWVFRLIENWPMFIVALLVGTAVSAILLGLLKKDVATIKTV